MIFRWTYFLLPRLVLGTLIAIFLGYGFLFVYNEILFPDSSGSVPVLVLLAAVISFISGWILWTAAGRLQVRHLLSSAETSSEIEEYHKTQKAFRRAHRIIRESSHFPPAVSKAENEAFVNRFADFCISAGLNDASALTAYAEYLKINRDDESFARRIIPLVVSSQDIRPEHFGLLNDLYNVAADSAELRDFLAASYLNYEVYNSDSLDILLKAIRDYSSLRPLSLKFLLPRMLDQNRRDMVAAEIYVEAFNSGLEHRDLKPMLVRLADQAKYEGKTGSLTDSIEEALNTIPGDELSEIRDTSRIERIERIPLDEKPYELEGAYEKAADSDDYDADGDVIEFKPGRTAVMLEGFAAALRKIPNLTARLVVLLWRTLLSLVNLILNRWHVVRWILVGALGLVIVFGLIKSLSMRTSQQNTVSLEVLSDKPFTIQVAAFKDKSRAEKYIRESNITSLKPYISSAHGETVWHQVRLGHYDSIEQAKQAAQEMKLKNYFIANFSPGMYLE